MIPLNKAECLTFALWPKAIYLIYTLKHFQTREWNERQMFLSANIFLLLYSALNTDQILTAPFWLPWQDIFHTITKVKIKNKHSQFRKSYHKKLPIKLIIHCPVDHHLCHLTKNVFKSSNQLFGSCRHNSIHRYFVKTLSRI